MAKFYSQEREGLIRICLKASKRNSLDRWNQHELLPEWKENNMYKERISPWSKTYCAVCQTWWRQYHGYVWLPAEPGHFCLLMMWMLIEVAGWIICAEDNDSGILQNKPKSLSRQGNRMFFNGQVSHLISTEWSMIISYWTQSLRQTHLQRSSSWKWLQAVNIVSIFMIMLVWLLSFEHQVQHIFKPTVDLHFNHILTIWLKIHSGGV